MSYFAAGGTNSGAHPRRCRGGTPLSGVSLRPSGRTPPGSRINCQTSSDHLLSLVRKGYRIGEAEREQSVARGASGFLTRLTRVGQRSPGVPQPQRRADAGRDLRSATAASPAPPQPPASFDQRFRCGRRRTATRAANAYSSGSSERSEESNATMSGSTGSTGSSPNTVAAVAASDSTTSATALT